jgi:glycosyltransferase involved in cell wall biosynthesis
MPHNIRIISTYPPRRCGIGTFSRDLATALAHFTAEVGHIRVAAIDNGSGPYDIPVDLVIDQYNPESWRNAIAHVCTRAAEARNPTVVILQHEFGLDPRFDGESASPPEAPRRPAGERPASSFVKLAQAFHERGLITLVYLHTVPDEPGADDKTTIQKLAAYSDGLIVTTESAIQILESGAYAIPREKLKHIDHGVRMHHLSHFDRLAIKREYDLENRFLITTLGMLSPGKGIEYGLRAYGRFLEESCTEEQRQRMVYLIAGKTHPEFVRAQGGEPYRQFRAAIDRALEEAKVTWCKVKELGGTNFDQYDVVFLDAFLDENTLLRLYGATNVMLLPYLNMQQISSGILADTLGAGRVAITTKFRYARELLLSNKPCPEGLIIARYARGILVDAGEPSVEQMAQALDYVVFHEGERLRMERQAHQRGYQMRWTNSAWALLQYIDFVREEKEIVTGRGIKFLREKPSKLDIFRHQRILVAPMAVAASQDNRTSRPSRADW